LDCINLVRNNSWQHDGLESFLQKKAEGMLGWLKAITFQNGDIPTVNDSVFGIGPSSNELLSYASRLGVNSDRNLLSTSGFRMIRFADIELFIDVGNIGPDYIPGHAHSDTFNFLIYFKKQPLVVDVGISTYDSTSQRIEERSTKSHNTVEVNGKDQSEVWGSFRVGRRAKIISTTESNNEIVSSHNGYRFLGITHQRSWKWDKNELVIIDELDGATDETSAAGYLHFHPTVDVLIKANHIAAGPLVLFFQDQQDICSDNYTFACGFNDVVQAKLLKITFSKRLVTTIRFTE
jgi:uncharacterized heparinase superfamily protein